MPRQEAVRGGGLPLWGNFYENSTTNRGTRPKKGAVLAGIVILVVFLAGLFIINLDIIREGVSIEGIDVSGKNRQEAVRLLEARMEPILAREKLKLTYGSDIWEVGLEQIGGSFDYMGRWKRHIRWAERAALLKGFRNVKGA